MDIPTYQRLSPFGPPCFWEAGVRFFLESIICCCCWQIEVAIPSFSDKHFFLFSLISEHASPDAAWFPPRPRKLGDSW
jgi:hypothetical protein